MVHAFENSVQHLRYAFRQLRKAPGFTITAILTLALGIGALTTVATWTNAVLYNPWPRVPDSRTLRFIDATVLGSDGYSVSYDSYRFLREHARSFEDAAAFDLTMLNIASAGKQPEAVSAGIVSANYFHLLGVTPETGRFFKADGNDRLYGSEDEVVLSDALWRNRYAADPSVVGRLVSINGHAFTVVGVAPPEFAGIFGGIAESAWVPLSSLRDLSGDAPPDPLQHYGLQVVGRLRSGVPDATAAAEVHTLARTYVIQQHDARSNGWDLNLRDSAHFARGLFGVIGEQLPILVGASALLMILVCINIASLLGQHAARRRREVAIRTTLGATPGTIAAQVLAETGLLAVFGAVTGWGVSVGISRSIYALLPNFGMPVLFNLHSDLRILAFVTAVATCVTLVCGLYPVRQALRASQQDALHEGAPAVAGPTRNRLGQRILLGLQLAICFVLLVGCGLLTRSAFNVFNRDTGFDRQNTLTAFLDLSRSGYNQERAVTFEATLLQELRTAPGVAGATLTTHLPMGDEGSGNTRSFSIPGYVPSKGEEMDVITDFDGPDFFRTMGIRLEQGRDFAESDNPTSPKVAIINEAMARRYFPKGNAIGSRIVIDKIERQIVGVVGLYAYHNPDETDPIPVAYLPLLQGKSGYGYAIIAIRSRTTAGALAGALRRAVASLDSTLPLENVRTLDDVTGERYQMSRLPAELLSVYALASVLVAMLGLYAVMAYSVIERYREFALRIALGSTRAGIFQLVLSGIGVTAMIGLVVGGVGSIAAVRLLRSLLFGVAPFDFLSYCAASVLLLITVFFSGLVPARRAASIQPMEALRNE